MDRTACVQQGTLHQSNHARLVVHHQDHASGILDRRCHEPPGAERCITFASVEAPTELGAQYECGATPPKKFVPSATPQYGTYYGAVLQVVQDGRPGGTIVLVWRRVTGEWRLVSYRAVE